MADFGTHNEFRKGYKLGKTNQFADPTYLSFSLMFDFFEGYSSPLLAGPARAFLKNQLEAEGDIAEVKMLFKNMIHLLHIEEETSL